MEYEKIQSNDRETNEQNRRRSTGDYYDRIFLFYRSGKYQRNHCYNRPKQKISKKEPLTMKNFNYLTEKQMSKTTGGVAMATIIGLCLAFISAVTFGTKVSAAANKAGK